MIRENSLGDKIFDALNIVFMVILVTVTIYPFLYVLYASLSSASLLMSHRGLLIAPLEPNLKAYFMVFSNPNIITGFINTAYYIVVGTSVSLLFTSFGAYALSRRRFYFGNAIMLIIVFTMFFSGGLIPFYLLVQKLHMTNLLSLTIVSLLSTWNLIIMRTAFKELPASLEESTKIDGGGDFTVLFKVVLPLSMPVIAVMILFYGVARWNDWFYPLLFLKDRSMYPLQLILREILILNDTDKMMSTNSLVDKEKVGNTIKYATIIITTVPIVILYPFLQKFFVKGVMIGAIKG